MTGSFCFGTFWYWIHSRQQLLAKGGIPRHRHPRDFLKLFLWQAERGSRQTGRNPREDVGEDDVGVGVVECGLNETMLDYIWQFRYCFAVLQPLQPQGSLRSQDSVSLQVTIQRWSQLLLAACHTHESLGCLSKENILNSLFKYWVNCRQLTFVWTIGEKLCSFICFFVDIQFTTLCSLEKLDFKV